ncbi:trypsin-like peptidase domain-containing protein [Streptomyces sp. HSW2009]|uniref:S1C family serine protease n=1 Tax=Streptomyces sp. HSW2009 TaxID=3142890 RepID=UPI0032ED69C2
MTENLRRDGDFAAPAHPAGSVPSAAPAEGARAPHAPVGAPQPQDQGPYATEPPTQVLHPVESQDQTQVLRPVESQDQTQVLHSGGPQGQVPHSVAAPAHGGFAGYGAQPVSPPAPAGAVPGGYAGFGAGAPAGPPAGRPRGRRTGVLLAAVALVSAVVAGAAGAVVGSRHDGGSGNGSAAPVVSAGVKGGTGDVSAVAKALAPSIVEIAGTTSEGRSLGSGVIISSNGEIVTNNHVVAGADELTVTLSDGTRKRAELVGADAGKDLALIKLENASGLRAAALGDSQQVRVGDEVVAIGSPEGLTGTVTSGIVSALDREVTVDGGNDDQGQQGNGGWPFEFEGRQYNGDVGRSKTSYRAIQTDASLNHGNSGGALINMKGEVIGINSAISTPSSMGGSGGSVGLGFAIPSNTVKDDLAALRGGGTNV